MAYSVPRFLIAAAMTAVIVAALFLWLTLPARTRALGVPVPATAVTGAYHVHTVRSDGTGTIDQVAGAAARAGLRFVIVTDHGDATRPPDPPAYRHGVLTIDAVEIATDAGHVVALGMPGAAPYPLAGDPRDVIEDIHRLGGVAVIAHPDSADPMLRWRGSPDLAYDGIEWLSADSEWRDKSWGRLAETAAHGLVRPAESIAALFARPARTLDRWDTLAPVRPMFGLAALDAHARIGWGDALHQHTILARPTYETMFRTLTDTALLDAPFSGVAALDADRLLRAIEVGHVYSTVDAAAQPAVLTFTAAQGSTVAGMGDRMPVASTRLRASVPAPTDARIVLFRNGLVIASEPGAVDVPVASAGAYRVEVLLPGLSVPWVASNPITLADHEPATAESARTLPSSVMEVGGAWHLERDETSTARQLSAAGETRLDFALGTGVPHGQYAAMVTDLDHGLSGFEKLQFTARALRPMRVSFQLRRNDTGERWRKSVYLDPMPRTITINLNEFRPADASGAGQPAREAIRALLVVVDTLNSLPGDSGSLWISNVRFAR